MRIRNVSTLKLRKRKRVGTVREGVGTRSGASVMRSSRKQMESLDASGLKTVTLGSEKKFFSTINQIAQFLCENTFSLSPLHFPKNVTIIVLFVRVLKSSLVT